MVSPLLAEFAAELVRHRGAGGFFFLRDPWGQSPLGAQSPCRDRTRLLSFRKVIYRYIVSRCGEGARANVLSGRRRELFEIEICWSGRIRRRVSGSRALLGGLIVREGEQRMQRDDATSEVLQNLAKTNPPCRKRLLCQ